MEQRVGWQPGRPGKALFDTDGSLCSWNTNGEFGAPSHREFAADHAIRFAYPVLYISDNGSFYSATALGERDLDLEARVHALDRRMKPQQLAEEQDEFPLPSS
jgi:hypothetical protein